MIWTVITKYWPDVISNALQFIFYWPVITNPPCDSHWALATPQTLNQLCSRYTVGTFWSGQQPKMDLRFGFHKLHWLPWIVMMTAAARYLLPGAGCHHSFVILQLQLELPCQSANSRLTFPWVWDAIYYGLLEPKKAFSSRSLGSEEAG